MAKYLIATLILFFFGNCQSQNKYAIEYDLTENEESFLDTLQYYTFQYFLGETNHQTGLVKDRSTEKSPASIAAVGFAIPSWAIGAERGWIEKEKAIDLTLNSLRFFWNSEQSADALATGYKGLYYHFIDMQSGERVWECELSTIDTGISLKRVRSGAATRTGCGRERSRSRTCPR